MAKRQHVERSVGPWAKQKLDALENYLEAYMLVMKKQPFTLFYIDAFAGAGIARVRGTPPVTSSDDATWFLPDDLTVADEEEVAEYIAGSPLRALGLSRRFDHYRFVDRDPERAEDLRQLADRFEGANLMVLTRDANEAVQDIASKFTNRLWRGVAFLDPYGPHLHWATLAALAATGKFDVILNFPLDMAINRLIKRDGNIPEAWAVQLDMCFGDHGWRDIAFEKSEDLFGAREDKHKDAADRLLQHYLVRLKGIFTAVSSPSLVRNTRGAPLYYLIWASSNGRGLPIAEHVLKQGEKVKPSNRRRSA